MLPIENEPIGFNENQKRSDSEINKNEESDSTEMDTDAQQNDIAGNASGNLPTEENPANELHSPSDNNGRGFLGDFAKPQHDE